MRVIIIHKNNNSASDSGNGLLRFAFSSEPIYRVIVDGVGKNLWLLGGTNVVVAIPEGWGLKPCLSVPKIMPYAESVPTGFDVRRRTIRNSWFVVSNGRFATQINRELLDKVLTCIRADVVAVNIKPESTGKQEKVRLTAQGKVVGFHRLYSDSAELAPVPAYWPHHIFIKTNVLDRLLAGGTLPVAFSTFLERCQSNALELCAINMGGTPLDLETEEGLLNFCRIRLSEIEYSKFKNQNLNSISQDVRFVGKVLLGKNVQIGTKAVVVGPTIIANNVKIAKGAVINSSVIGPDVCVPRNQLVQNLVVRAHQCNWKRLSRPKGRNFKQTYYPKVDFNNKQGGETAFRAWPRFSYVGGLKRIADCFAAIIVLILFAPVIPVIAIAIKLNSPGSVFFRDKRQGLHGDIFNCLKFRTMAVGADKIQDKLRIVSQVDGPQFKMADDPRISAVGRFLRDTYIDEVPQFFNVLFGQMSVVGPRPSPEAENTLCPYWRDARLSVRPGITGLWQVCRTRQPMKDFQEWIHYDTKYVRNLSLKMDLWICWQTIRKLVKDFVRQF